MSKNSAIDLLVVDDHPVFRDAVEMLLDPQPDIRIAAMAEDGTTALRLASERSFDVILLDIRLPDISGIDVAHRLVKEGCTASIVMLSMRDEDEVRQALPPGVHFASKASLPAELPEIIRQAANHHAE
jgi:DNA-binding NarL/FixJ family response regulator